MPWVVEVPEPLERLSSLPVGGSPADDRAYLAWRDEFLFLSLDRDLAARWHDAADRPMAAREWGLDAFLFRALGGPSPLFPSDVPTYSHRLRFLAINLKLRRRELIRHAARFIDEATDR